MDKLEEEAGDRCLKVSRSYKAIRLELEEQNQKLDKMSNKLDKIRIARGLK